MIVGKKIISLTIFIFILTAAGYLLMFKEQITFLHIAGGNNGSTINNETYDNGSLCAGAITADDCQQKDVVGVDLITKNFFLGQDYVKDCSWQSATNTCANKYLAKNYFTEYLSRLSLVVLIAIIAILFGVKLMF